MAKEIGGTLYLNKEETASFLNNLLHPDEEAIERRNAFLAECDKLIIEHKDGYTVISCPDINIDEEILKELGT